jgi:predicted Zn finger-like uncharacterized protein
MVGAETRFATEPMLLACPNCATTYDVKADVIGESGRSLRCARCLHVWFATVRRNSAQSNDKSMTAGEQPPADAQSTPDTPAPEHAAAAPSRRTLRRTSREYDSAVVAPPSPRGPAQLLNPYQGRRHPRHRRRTPRPEPSVHAPRAPIQPARDYCDLGFLPCSYGAGTLQMAPQMASLYADPGCR